MYDAVSFLLSSVTVLDVQAQVRTDLKVHEFGGRNTIDGDTILLSPFDELRMLLAWVQRWRHLGAHLEGCR
jgi:hypothetical protein